MASLSSILPKGLPQALPKGLRRRGLAKVVFACYGPLDCNSAGHIAGFAGELAARGYAVAVAGRPPLEAADAFGPPAFQPFALQDLADDPARVIGFDGALEPDRTVLVCWTPRKASRTPVMKAARRLGVPYLVHFEDNEDHLTLLRIGANEQATPEEAFAAESRDAAERATLMAGAIGATVIEDRLRESLPPGLPTLLLEPGVDHALFGAPLPNGRREELLRAAGVPAGAAVMVYPGNIHRANLSEMAELYRALWLLKSRGRRLVLLKTGKDDVPVAEALGFHPADAGVHALGMVDRPLLVELLKCADLFVQPGAPGPFNDYRLPSKLPEFMAVGRPVILPAANVGLRVRDGADALVLHGGEAAEIAEKVEAVLDDPLLAARLSTNARSFARRHWRWDVQGRKLADFLEHLHRARA